MPDQRPPATNGVETGGEERLVRDLRRAFDCHVDALTYSGSCWLGHNGGGAEALGGAPAHVALEPGTRLGDFLVINEVGRGGMGVVYRAKQVSLGRQVALKILPDYARHSRTARDRFLAESRAAARIHHTNVVAIHARGEHDGQYYYAMELIEGPSLDRLIRSDPDWFRSGDGHDETSAHAAPRGPGSGSGRRVADYRHLASLLAEVAEGLACAHEHGIVHRDVKPHNLLVNTDGRLFLTDFGLARLAEEPHLTQSGQVLGTPSYLSPEQIRGSVGDIDHRTDVYALGVTLYEILARRRPFTGETREQIAHAITCAPLVPPRRLVADVPLPLETICLRAMEREPRRRYRSAADLAGDLRRFGQGRPIRARRPGPLRRAAGAVRRHRRRAAAGLALAAIAALTSGWTWTVLAGRHREARHLLDDAYRTLAFDDYRDAARVVADIDRAVTLGAESDETDLVRALADIGLERDEEAARRLSRMVAAAPDDRRARYLLAWAQWRAGHRDASQDAFRDATARGGPRTADGWFFRGLACHFADADAAIESYRRAIAMRAADERFYPQAALHLARAQNQRMYATRSLEPFAEAERALRQLATHGVYGAYPHYLLSITHRLAAEIYSGSEGTRGREPAERHFREALAWARRGQEIEPGYDRPITAEAECLEATGDFAAAARARTRAIDAAAGRAAWEGYHYRWRLHYWRGELEPALADLERCAEFDPGSRFYAHVYPALVLAEMGRGAEAAAHARAIAGAGGGRAEDVIWAATCLRLVGRPEEGQALLDGRADVVEFEPPDDRPGGAAWLRILYDQCRSGDHLAELETLAGNAPKPWDLWGEAHFHTAALRLARDDLPSAIAGFRRASRSFDSERRFSYHGKLLWRRLLRGPLTDGGKPGGTE